MKTLGLIGGISYHSTAVYYKLINQRIQEKLGGDHAATLLLYSVNYNDFKQLQIKDDWQSIGEMLTEIALKLEGAGAEGILIACNTAHIVADALSRKLNIPFLHIVDVAANEIAQHTMNKVGLLGTKFVMEQPFFIERLRKHGIDVVLPEYLDRNCIHDSILEQLAKGNFNNETKQEYLKIIDKLAANGAQAILLGCTEIGMLLSQNDTSLRLFDTTSMHVDAAVAFALSNYTGDTPT